MARKLRSHLPELVDTYNLEVSKKRSGREHRLTQRKLSEETGIALSTISRLYRNQFTRLDNNTIVTLCDFFNCDLTDLITLVVEEKDDGQKPARKKKKIKE